MSAMADARRAYLDQPVNFGTDGHATRVAEADAFTAGWEAALAAVTRATPADWPPQPAVSFLTVQQRDAILHPGDYR